MAKRDEKKRMRLDDAARAAWLYYVARNSQDEIAKKMCISRQSVQRLISLAMQENLIKFRLDHPVASCMELAQQIKDQYGLSFCKVTLSDPTSEDPALGIAEVAATRMERYFKTESSIVMALGTGREIREAVKKLPPMNCPQHKVVSLVGTLAPDGSASFNDVIMRIGDIIKAPHHPMAVPVVATSSKERDIICAQKPIQSNIELAQSADIAFIGIGEINDSPPLLTDGFITQKELNGLISAGAVGEIVGWAFDKDGVLIDGLTNSRVASVPLSQPPSYPVIGVARGNNKLQAIRGALAGQWISGLITDEATAKALIT
ncbi:MAG: Transcriptional regulator of mannitol utilization, DeoR family protein [uncultured Thiotrichaceae bacterium]|uniref:Transcriptional regulator of mannitol utilization, DeoR family protein n=1 Tax=uncultured Thiotrichaceae bacterium TaxID=298394 RepID=A0A6S6S9E6_9GAMM|nr:MAG: Transcriptional regulator of mannitol utilization, DeoR family protein [uncultured Thiotrichaceae bacterium]